MFRVNTVPLFRKLLGLSHSPERLSTSRTKIRRRCFLGGGQRSRTMPSRIHIAKLKQHTKAKHRQETGEKENPKSSPPIPYLFGRVPTTFLISQLRRRPSDFYLKNPYYTPPIGSPSPAYSSSQVRSAVVYSLIRPITVLRLKTRHQSTARS